MTCWNCGQTNPQANGFQACSKCNAPNYAGADKSPFTVLGAPKRFDLDLTELERRYLTLSRWLHPDRYATMGALWKAKCGEYSALLNEAYGILKNDESRLEALLQQSGVQMDKSSGSQVPAEFAERFFEVQEAVFEDPEKVKELADSLKRDVAHAETETLQSITDMAKKINWEAPSEQNSTAALNDLRTKRSYLRSLMNNLEKLAS